MIQAPIQDKELSEYLAALPADDMIHFTMCEGRIRGALFQGTRFVNQMRAQHNTEILESYILGQACLSAALLIPALMKGREHLSLHYDVPDSPAKGFCVEADSTGWVRGYLMETHIPVEKPLENWDLRPFLGGEGYMTIQTVHPEDKYPQTSSVNTTGNIADDIVFYFDRSAQLKTALTTSIQMDKQGRIIGAGGIFIQVMPESGGTYNGVQKRGAQIDSASDKAADDALITDVESVFRTAPSLGLWFSQGRTHEELLQELFGSFSPVVALHRSIVFDCPCSEESYAEHLRRLPADQLAELKKDDTLEIICRNCGSVYRIPTSGL